jgi:hypothetical protein
LELTEKDIKIQAQEQIGNLVSKLPKDVKVNVDLNDIKFMNLEITENDILLIINAFGKVGLEVQKINL